MKNLRFRIEKTRRSGLTPFIRQSLLHKSRRFNFRWILFPPLIVLGALVVRDVCLWVSACFHDRLIVINKYPQPIERLTVTFRGDPEKRITFQDVPANWESWKPCDPKLGYYDSIRLVKVQALASDKTRIGANKWFDVGIGVGPFIVGSYLAVTIDPQGKVTTDINQ